MFLTIVNLLFVCVSGHILEDVLIDERRQTHGDDSSRTPTNVWMEVAEDTLTVHWTPPADLDGARFCIIVHQAENNPVTFGIPVSTDQRMYVISGLNRNTLYKTRLYCWYGSAAGPSTDWFGAATRTVSVQPSVCTGSLPNAILEPFCLEYPRRIGCDFTCHDGYRKSDVPDVIRGFRTRTEDISVSVLCINGTWSTSNEDRYYGINDICLPEAEFQKCPLTIPNGILEPHCGPATDWLCNFECTEGYHSHVYMSGSLKNFRDDPGMLYCDNGTWKTGYEDLGVDVSGVCVSEEHNCTNSDAIPNGSVLHLPCPSGYVCGFTCDAGFHRHALAGVKPSCVNGVWGLRTTKYDPSITPQTLCVPDDAMSACPRNIPNGRIADPNCTMNCWPNCDDGYYAPGNNGPGYLTCEDGKWLTDEAPYNGDNICFPEGGHPCPLEIPNGLSNFKGRDHWRKDNGSSRMHVPYKCNDGFRSHRTIMLIECIAGKWVTAQERFGLNLSSICIPYTSY